MRTGADYKASLKDGRRVWIMGEGRIEDVATHPATRGMVQDYADWYDRHMDPEWRETLYAPADGKGQRTPWAYFMPTDGTHLRGMGRCYSKTLFLNGGNVTHTPAYGHLIALGILHTVRMKNHSAKNVSDAEAHLARIGETGRFLTFSAGAATIGQRLSEDPAERLSLRVVRETDAGVVIRGKVGMHTSPCYAEDVYIGAQSSVDIEGHRATFSVPVNAKGVTVLCRKPSVHHPSGFISPMSTRFDELDGQMWLDDVFIPWERVFFVDENPEPIATWLFWHQLYCWLAKAEFTLGCALACAHVMGLKENPQTVDYVLDLIEAVQTVRSCQISAELDCDITKTGWAQPNHAHVAVGSIALLKARPRMVEILRALPGSSLVVAPGAEELADPELKRGFEQAFGGGGYTAEQRAALLHLAWDHVGSALDARESVFELHANGGIPSWRGRLRRRFDSYNELANGVLKVTAVDIPPVDVSSIPNAPLAPRRPVTPGGAAKK